MVPLTSMWCMAGETGRDREGPSPLGPINSMSWVGPGRDQYVYNENGPFLLLLDCFTAIVIHLFALRDGQLSITN